MAKKKTTAKPTGPDTVITLTLPPETGLVRTGTLLVKRGDLAVMRQVSYSNALHLAEAIRDAALQLKTTESNPPKISNGTGETPAAPAPVVNDTPDTDDSTEDDTELSDDDTEDDLAADDLLLIVGEPTAKAERLFAADALPMPANKRGQFALF